MKKFIKSDIRPEKLPLFLTRICLEITAAAFLLLIIHYIILSKSAGDALVEARYLKDSAEYLVASGVLSLSFGLLFDIFVRKAKK